MVEAAGRIPANILNNILGSDQTESLPAPGQPIKTSKSFFDDLLDKAVNALGNVSALEGKTDTLMRGYAAGQVDLSDVMIASAKMNIAVQLAVTTVSSAVSTFKEITQMQV